MAYKTILNVTGVDHFPRATEHIAEMVGMIAKLIAKGHAYPASGDVYFDVTSDPGYGKLCHRTLDDPGEGARLEPSEKKRVHRGGSYLCTDHYCTRYMVGTRGKGEVSSGSDHLGFRCVRSAASS